MKNALLLGLTLLVGTGCGADPSAEPRDAAVRSGEVVVYATDYPSAFLSGRLIAGVGRVECPIPPDADPIHWEPSRDVLLEFRAATLVVTNGAEFVRWIENASLPENRIVRSANGFRSDFLHGEEQTHSHGPGGTHTHAEVNPYTWLDPVNARRQAATIARALTDRLPDSAARIEENLGALEADLEDLQTEWRGLDEELREVNLMTSHPTHDYLLARFGWTARVLELDAAAALTEDSISQVRSALRADGPNLLLWDAAPLHEPRTRLRDELGVRSLVVPALTVRSKAQRENGDDYLGLQRAAIARIRSALE